MVYLDPERQDNQQRYIFATLISIIVVYMRKKDTPNQTALKSIQFN